MVDLNKLAAGALAGLAAGAIIGGLGSRLAMRIVALLIGSPPGLTAGGVLGLVAFGGILGLVAGLIFAVLRPTLARFLPGVLGPGLAYGAILAFLLSLPFFLTREGELGLLPPLQEALLFGPIGLIYGAGLALVEERLRSRFARSQAAAVSWLWLGVFGLSLLLAGVSMGSLANESARMPVTFIRLLRQQGNSLQVQSLNALLAIPLLLGYCGLSAAVFWQGARNRTAKLSSLVLLWFAAAFFNNGQVFPGAMLSSPIVRWLPALIQTLGLSGMVVLLLAFPDGRVTPAWVRRLVPVYAAVLFVGFATTATGARQPWAEPLLAALVLGGLLAGLICQCVRFRAADRHQRRQTSPVVAAFALAITTLTVLWLAQMALPDLRGRTLTALPGLFTFVPYTLPWLLLPLSALYAQTRRGPWKDARPHPSLSDSVDMPLAGSPVSG